MHLVIVWGAFMKMLSLWLSVYNVRTVSEICYDCPVVELTHKRQDLLKSDVVYFV